METKDKTFESAQKNQIPSGSYDPNKNYAFTDKDGNTFYSKGDNGYVWEAITNGVPISVNDKGDWYVTPYLEVTPDKIIQHIPEWFKSTAEYDTWKNNYSSYLQPGINKDTFGQLNDILKAHGSQGYYRLQIEGLAKKYGVTEADLLDRNFQNTINLSAEAQDVENPGITLWGETKSAADWAREVKGYSKEDLAEMMQNLQKTLKVGSGEEQGSWTGSREQQEAVVNALGLYQVLNAVDDNYKKFGDGKEFEGLLQASGAQKFNTAITAEYAAISSTWLGLPARLVRGALNWFVNGKWDTAIEKDTEAALKSTSVGYGLEGTEGYLKVGSYAGAGISMVATIGLVMATGPARSGIVDKMAKSSNAVIRALGTFSGTNIGSMLIADFALTDIPMDLLNFTNAWAEKGFKKAIYDPDATQPLVPIPFSDQIPILKDINPQVSQGLLSDLAGDIILDGGAYIVGAALGVSTDVMDDLTNGAVSRVKEKVAIKNLEIQSKLTDIPVLGTGWKKFINHFMGAQNAEYIRKARKQSILKGSMDPYIRAHNYLTLKNQGGAAAVIGEYAMMKQMMDFDSTVKAFQKNADDLGGMGKTQIVSKVPMADGIKNIPRTVPDILPQKVKQGLLDIEHLAELKGQVAKEGGLVFNPKRAAEIQRLEAKVDALPKEIKDFADKFSELNKQVEALGVKLGITNEDWYKAMLIDPEFEKYMVRQTLVPQTNQRTGSAGEPAILNKGRKGYYAKNYLDPLISLDMKVEALGRAYAWNLQSEHVAAMALAQGEVLAGASGVRAAEKLSEIKGKISQVETTRAKVGYDATIKKVQKQADQITQSVNKINDLIAGPEKISLQSVYDASRSKEINSFINKFRSGEIKIGDGVGAKAGLSDADVTSVISNTYCMRSGDGTVPFSAADNAQVTKEAISGKVYNEGLSDDGVAYRYVIEDGVVTSFHEISDASGMANTINKLGGIHKVDSATISKLGPETAHGINRMLMYYRDNMPNLPVGVTFRQARKMPRNGSVATGWIPGMADGAAYGYKIENGHIVATDYPLYHNEYVYHPDCEQRVLEMTRYSSDDRFHPRNAVGVEVTAIHEYGHATMARLSVLRLNEKIDSGKLKISEGMSQTEIARLVDKEWDILNKELVTKAFDRLGVKYTDKDLQKLWQQTSYDEISKYAGSGKPGSDFPAYQWETYSEAMVDYWANSSNASKFSIAIMEQMREESQRFAKAAIPEEVMRKNGLSFDKNMFKDGQYNFPPSAKTKTQRARWLAKKRKENPYINKKGLLTEDEYIKANLWDTFFKKEIESFDPTAKTSMPDVLVKKSGEFLDDLGKRSAEALMEEIKKASIEGFDHDLAMIALGRNADDVSDALDSFILRQIDARAKEMASKMDGGLTEENLNIARITLYQDKSVNAAMAKTLGAIIPDVPINEVRNKINTLFDEQSKGLAAYEALPVDYKGLSEEYAKALVELQASNKYALGKGKETDKALKADGFVEGSTQVIHYIKNGEDVYVVVKDPTTAAILKRPADYKNTGVVPEAFYQAANLIAKRYRLGTTGMSLPAMVKNVLRDPIQAWKTAGANPLTMMIDPQAFYRSLRYYGLDDATIKDVTLKLQRWASAGTMGSEIRKYGGATPQTVGYKNRAEQFEKWYNNNILDSKIYTAAGAPLEMWESFFRNQVAQQSFVRSMRKSGGDIDKSLARAMFDSSNATTNFSHTIYFARRLTAAVPYLASGVNGIASFWRLFNIDPLGMIGRITSGVIVPTMAITAWNLSTEENRRRYLDLPEWYRDSHIVIIGPSGDIFAIPIPEEIGSFYGTTRRLMEYTNDANVSSIPSILAQGAFGFLPGDTDGFFDQYGNIQLKKGVQQFAMGLIPQAATAAYEAWAEYNTFVGYSTADFEWWNKMIYNLGNVFGSSFVNIVNDIGFLCGASSSFLYGKSTAEKLSQELFGIGFDDSKNQFMELVGSPSSIDYKTGKETKATGLFKESEDLQKQLDNIDKEIAISPEDKKAELEELKQKKIDEFGERVKNLTNKYMELYSNAGGIEDWQRKKLIQILNLGNTTSSAPAGSYQAADANQAALDEYALGRQRYIDLGLPTNPTIEALTPNKNGNLTNTVELQAAIDRFYGAPKQAAQDYKTAVEKAGLKDIRDEFYNAIEKIYDTAEAQGIDPDYDMIERIQARYLQAVDAVMVPIINQYGISILNNNDFINEVRSELGGMIPGDDWKQSIRNKKKFLSKKDYPLASVDVKKWLQDRYKSGMRNRGLDSDQVVKDRISNVEDMIDRGEKGKAKGEIESIMRGVDKANFYISSTDYQHLLELYNMVK